MSVANDCSAEVDLSTRAPFLLLVLALVALGVTTIYYRHVEMGVPLTAGERIAIWQVEAEISFTGKGDPVNAQLTLPRDGRFELVEEFTASPAYGVHVLRDEQASKVIWSKRQVEGNQTLYYKGSFKTAPRMHHQQSCPSPMRGKSLIKVQHKLCWMMPISVLVTPSFCCLRFKKYYAQMTKM